MNSDQYYPRRTDMVRAVQFDGTVQSAQKIAQVTRLPVSVDVSWLGLETLSVDGVAVEHNQFVVLQEDGFTVLDNNAFRNQYSPDGF